MKITIKEVAEKAGVSRATVSKVINDSAEISETTKAKVLQVIKELGFIPNNTARTLKTRATKRIAFIAKFEKDQAFYTPHLFEIMSGAAKHLAKKGYTVSIVNHIESNAD